MNILKPLSESMLSGGAEIIQRGLQGGKLAVIYGKPAFEKSACYIKEAAKWGAENTLLATCTVVGTTGAVILAAPALITAPILSTLGFTASGIQAGMCTAQGKVIYLVARHLTMLCELGSVATTAHSLIGNIAAGSIFAMGQSAGAGGTGLAIVNGVAQVGGAAISAGSAGLAWFKAK